MEALFKTVNVVKNKDCHRVKVTKQTMQGDYIDCFLAHKNDITGKAGNNK